MIITARVELAAGEAGVKQAAIIETRASVKKKFLVVSDGLRHRARATWLWAIDGGRKSPVDSVLVGSVVIV